MQKPKHLDIEYASQFKDRSIVDAYHHRPAYPAEVFTILTNLMAGGPRAVLDVGCGTGDLARNLAPLVERVDAVDFSQNMIEKGKSLPGGDHPNLNWIYGRVEEVPLHPPYALVTAGESLHWMEWDIVLPLFRKILVPGGYLAIVGRIGNPKPWDAELRAIIPQFATNKDYQPYDLIEELELRGLFQKRGEIHTTPVPFVQSVDNYIESFHSMNGFSRDRMGEEMATAFDDAVRNAVSSFQKDGQLTMSVSGGVVWGIPGRI